MDSPLCLWHYIGEQHKTIGECNRSWCSRCCCSGNQRMLVNYYYSSKVQLGCFEITIKTRSQDGHHCTNTHTNVETCRWTRRYTLWAFHFVQFVMYLAKATHLIIGSPSLCPTVSKPLEAPASHDVAGTSTPSPVSCGSGCQHNAGCPPSRLLFECTPHIITCSSKGSPSNEEVEASSPTGSLQPADYFKMPRNQWQSQLFLQYLEYAASNGLNPAHVTQHIQWQAQGHQAELRGMAQIIEWNYRSVVVWDDALSKLVGWDAPAQSAGGEGKGEKAGDEDDEDEDRMRMLRQSQMFWLFWVTLTSSMTLMILWAWGWGRLHLMIPPNTISLSLPA